MVPCMANIEQTDLPLAPNFLTIILASASPDLFRFSPFGTSPLVIYGADPVCAPLPGPEDFRSSFPLEFYVIYSTPFSSQPFQASRFLLSPIVYDFPPVYEISQRAIYLFSFFLFLFALSLRLCVSLGGRGVVIVKFLI